MTVKFSVSGAHCALPELMIFSLSGRIIWSGLVKPEYMIISDIRIVMNFFFSQLGGKVIEY